MVSIEHTGEMRPWGVALEYLREQRGIKSSELCYRVRMGQPQYHRICTQLKDGPTMDTLGRLLKALGYSWEEWGRTYDAVLAGIAAELEEPPPLKRASNDAPHGGVSRGKPRATPLPRHSRGGSKPNP